MAIHSQNFLSIVNFNADTSFVGIIDSLNAETLVLKAQICAHLGTSIKCKNLRQIKFRTINLNEIVDLITMIQDLKHTFFSK